MRINNLEDLNQVIRKNALKHCSFLDDYDFRFLVVEAQAGQGKTALVRQFEAVSEREFIWITCGEQDADPRYFFQRVIDSCAAKAPRVFCGEALAPLTQQLITPEFIQMAPRLVAGLLKSCHSSFTFVFDDLHLLQDSEASKEIFKIFAHTAKCAKFISISRYPVLSGDAPLFERSSSIYIDKELLAFSHEEVARLYTEHLGVAADLEKISKLMQATEGWITGLILLSSATEVGGLYSAESGELNKYFSGILADSVSNKALEGLALLALLPELSTGVLNGLAMVEEAAWLEAMVARSFFVRSVSSGEDKVYIFHHLLQAFLVQLAESTIPESEIADFRSRAGECYLAAGEVVHSLNCFSAARSWEQLEFVMKTSGQVLIFHNHYHTILSFYKDAAEDDLKNMPWSCLAIGAALMELAPAQCPGKLEQSISLFREQKDMLGELLAISLLLRFYIIISGQFGHRGDMIRRGGDILREISPVLPEQLLSVCAESIALGFLHCEADFEEGNYFSHLLERTRNVDSRKIAWNCVSRIVVDAFHGDLRASLRTLSPFYVKINELWVSPVKIMGLYICQLNFLMMQGDFYNYRLFKSSMDENVRQMMNMSYLGRFILVWDADILISEGRYAEALNLIVKHKDDPLNGEHISSQLLHYEFLALALMGRKDEMFRSLRKALRMRVRCGGPWFISLTHSLAGVALSIAGEKRFASRIVNKILNGIKDKGRSYQYPLVFASRAFLSLKAGEKESAMQDVQDMLSLLQRKGNTHFFGWAPDYMADLLAFAVENNIESDFARMLARKKLGYDILPDGSRLPLLSMKLIGDFEFRCGDSRLGAGDLAPIPRKFLTYLATAPDRSRHIDDVKLFLWPDSDAAKNKRKFDTLLSRVRKVLKDAFGKDSASFCLIRAGSKISLGECAVDLERINSFGSAGCALAGEGRYWEAISSFNLMDSYFPDATEEIFGVAVPDEGSVLAITRYLSSWSGVLVKGREYEKGLEVVDRALKLNIINDTLQRRRYNLLISLERPGEAMASVSAYSQALLQEGFRPADVEQTIEQLLGGN